MKKLLIPVDFSETSEEAVQFGVQLAAKCGYQVMLHHSVDFSDTFQSIYIDEPSYLPFTKKMIDDCEFRLENLMTKYQRKKVSMSKHLTTGSLVMDISRLAHDHDVDLIVMGTRGSSGFKEFLIGSNTEKVVRIVDCPVIAIPRKTEVKDIRKILVPVDLEELRPNFLKQICVFQKIFSASIEFLWVKTPHHLENIELVTEEFNNLLNEYQIASSSFTVIEDIFPQDGILIYTDNSESNMIAMGTHARRGLAHLFTGSLTEDVLNHTKVPLWSLKMDTSEAPINLEGFQDLRTKSQA